MAEPPILPKGIVINTSWIYDEVAKQPVVSPEAIKKYWRVYTTTFQRLIDPTANRLENFWWHVWGSDRRHLPGPVLARLFEDISTGPTFVKLRGPPNRYEPPSQPPSPELTPVQSPAIPEVKQATQGPKVEKKAMVSSSNKKPPAKPILKKPRGPSSSGPRPTARFASPLGSDTEEVGSRDSEVVSSTSTTVTAVGGESKAANSSSGKEPKKKTTASGPPKKKGPTFVASTASKRRPAMPRRQSSQSTTGGSDGTAKEKAREKSPSDTPEAEPRLSAKAAGKRPAVAVKPEDQMPSKRDSNTSTGTQDNLAKGQTKPSAARQPEVVGDRRKATPTSEEQKAKPPGSKTPQTQQDTQERPKAEVTSPVVAPRSDPFFPRRGSSETSRSRRGLAPKQPSLAAPSIAQTSNATARGTIIEFDENLPTKQLQENERLQSEPRNTTKAPATPLDPRFTPTPPSPVPAVPLGRSKSQLTLLLERQGEKKARR